MVVTVFYISIDVVMSRNGGGNDDDINIGVIVGISVPVVVLVFITVCIIVVIWRCSKKVHNMYSYCTYLCVHIYTSYKYTPVFGFEKTCLPHVGDFAPIQTEGYQLTDLPKDKTNPDVTSEANTEQNMCQKTAQTAGGDHATPESRPPQPGSDKH